jgi:hypothetical protein
MCKKCKCENIFIAKAISRKRVNGYISRSKRCTCLNCGHKFNYDES